jgi:S1-C subfamily serine protease
MPRPIRTFAALALSCGVLAVAPASADDKAPATDKPKAAKAAAAGGAAKLADPAAGAVSKLYDRVSPAFVAVKYTWDFELRRQELVGPGVVVSADGLVMCPLGVFNPVIPDAQMKGFKIVVPSQEKDADEVEAVFVGRDERTNLAFLRPALKSAGAGTKPKADPDVKAKADDKAKPVPAAKGEAENGDAPKSDANKTDASKSDGAKKDEPSKKDEPATKEQASKPDKPPRTWTPVKLESRPLKVGQRVWSVGVLPEAASYKTYLGEARVSAVLRGEIPQVLVAGGLTGTGSVVFDDDGKAVGFVNAQGGQPVFINDSASAMQAINTPPRIFTPAGDLLQSLTDPPVAGTPLALPWIGIPASAMAGLNKDVADVYGLANQPAVQIGDVIPDAPAAKAGVRKGDVILKVNGKPLERGDEADEVPVILRRQLMRMKVGDEVTLSVVRKRGQPPQDIKVKLEPAPKGANLAKRFFAEDLGFGVRELVFIDTYSRRLSADAKGVLVSLIKPQSSAQSGGLRGNGREQSDVITSLNGQPVTDIGEFETLYKAARKDKPKEALVLVVRREGRDDTVRIEPPQ